jgi:hypothetical protein
MRLSRHAGRVGSQRVRHNPEVLRHIPLLFEAVCARALRACQTSLTRYTISYTHGMLECWVVEVERNLQREGSAET